MRHKQSPMLRSVLQRHWDKPHWLLLILKISCHSWEAVRGNVCHTGVGNRSSEMCLRNKKELIFSIFLTVDQFWISQDLMKQRWSSHSELEDEEPPHTYSSSATVQCPALVYWEKSKYWFLFSIKRMFVWLHRWFAFALQFWQSSCQKERWLSYQTAFAVTPPCEHRWRGPRSSGWQSQSEEDEITKNHGSPHPQQNGGDPLSYSADIKDSSSEYYSRRSLLWLL